MSLKWDAKDPDEVLDYVCNWYSRLAGDTIVTSTWTVPAGITKDSDSISMGGAEGAALDVPDSATTIWLSGGTLAASYSLLNRIVTAGGRTMDQTVKIGMKTK